MRPKVAELNRAYQISPFFLLKNQKLFDRRISQAVIHCAYCGRIIFCKAVKTNVESLRYLKKALRFLGIINRYGRPAILVLLSLAGHAFRKNPLILFLADDKPQIDKGG